MFTAASFFAGAPLQRAGAPGGFAALPADAAAAKPASKSTTKANSKPQVHKLKLSDYAPADEYFGPMKLSILGIRNTIRDLGLKYDNDPSKGDATISSVAFAEKAIRDWQKRYPLDPQLPRNIYFLEHLYAKIQSPQGTQKAYATSTWLFSSYGTSPQARQLHREILAAKNATPAPIAASPSNTSQPGSSVDVPQNPNVTLPTPAASPAAAGQR